MQPLNFSFSRRRILCLSIGILPLFPMSAQGKHFKAWSQCTPQYRSTRMKNACDLLAPHCHSLNDGKLILQHLLTRLAREAPALESFTTLLDDNLCDRAVIDGVVALREEKAKNNLVHKPCMSLNDLDNVFVETVDTLDKLNKLGLSMSKHRYAHLRNQNVKLSYEASSFTGGRPSKVNDTSLINMVGKVLEEHVKESERVVVVGRGPKRRMVIAKHLMKTRYRLWCEIPRLHKSISWPTFRLLLRLHFPFVRSPRRNTDVCKHCKHFTKYLLPAARKVLQKARDRISSLLPSYFRAYDDNAAVQGHQANSEYVALIRTLVRYIDQKNFSAAGDVQRQRLSLADKLSLHASEARASHKLKGHLELLEAYEWHQISSRRQSYVAALRQNMPQNTAMLQTDFKENVKYPLGPDETSEEWHAQNKLSLTVFGANVVVPKRGGGHVEKFVLMVTDVLDHDAQAACMMTNYVIGAVRGQADVDWGLVEKLIVVADCGPHFRSRENIAHYCVTLPKSLQISVEVCWLGEQHGKSEVDRCFGWCNTWITQYIQAAPIHSLDNLITAFEKGSRKMMAEDPSGIQFLIRKFAPGSHRPSPRSILHAINFKVTRTYSLSSSLSRYAAVGVQIRNKVFSDQNHGEALDFHVQEQAAEAPIPWRVGYYDKPRTWEERGPIPGEINQVTQRFADQKNCTIEDMPTGRPTFLEACSAKALSLRRSAAKKKRQLAQLRQPQEDPGSSSSSSSSESDSSSSSSSS